MISAWMLHTAIVSAVLTIAALLAERVLRLWRREARVVWGAAMALSIVLPVVSIGQSLGWLPRFGDASMATLLVAGGYEVVLPAITVGARSSRLDVVFALVWAFASLAVITRFAIAARSLELRRQWWRPEVVDGERLLVSPDAGPAVVGFRRPAIVVPEWILDLDASLRALVLKHEREHLDGGDPWLLLGAVVIAAAAPWNLLLWYQLFRLRAAMELDCDQRVLRAYPDAHRYGSLLLAVAQRADRGALLAPALTESNSLLSRRITAMRVALPKHRITRTLLLATVAGSLFAVACEMRSPSEPKASAPQVAGPVVAQAPYFEFQVEDPVTPAANSSAPRYPDILRQAGVEGEVLAQYVVDEEGRVVPGSFKVLKSSHDLFTEAVSKALPMMRFNPARVGGKAVKQLVQQPFTFSIVK